MKRLMFPVLVVCVVMLFAGMGFAADIGFGVKGGVGFTNFSGDDADDFDSKMGFHAGAFVPISLIELITLQPEVLYSAVGAKIEESGVDGKWLWNLSYIQVPVLVKFYPPLALPVDLNVFAGPYIGLNLSGKYKATGDYETVFDDKGDLEDDLGLDRQTMDFGLTLGAGVDINKIVIDARYTFAFSSWEADNDLKNNAFSIMAGYRFK